MSAFCICIAYKGSAVAHPLIKGGNIMEITEMLDELKSKALGKSFWKHVRMHSRSAHSARNAVNWATRSMTWTSSPPEKNFMPPCAEAPMAAGKILRCWKVKMIFTSYFSRDWSKL